MRAAVLALVSALVVAGVWVGRRHRKPCRVARPGPETLRMTDGAYIVPMTAWGGTARYNPNSHTVRIRWTPTTTEAA